eukprot:evm.model.scf_298.13 EVM.evm.TU.scf_298.13   scf_298:85022-89034(-)
MRDSRAEGFRPSPANKGASRAVASASCPWSPNPGGGVDFALESAQPFRWRKLVGPPFFRGSRRARRAAVPLASLSSAAAGQMSPLDVDWGLEALRKLRERRGLRWRWQRRLRARGTRMDGQEGVDGRAAARWDWLRNLMSGAMAAVVSRTCLAPMERVRMDIMLRGSTLGPAATARRVLRAEGVLGFWRGNGINAIRTAPFKAINFFTYDTYSRAFLRMAGTEGPGQLERFAAGACAGLTAVITCFPLDTLRTRILAGSSYRGLGHALTSIVRNEGFPALYQGCIPALVSMAPSCAVFYGLYDLLKWSHLSKTNGCDGLDHNAGLQLGVWYTLAFGAISGAAAEISVYPLEVIRRRMQLQTRKAIGVGLGVASRGRAVNSLQQMGMVCRTIMRTQGIRGFYMGLPLSTMQTLPNAALSFFFYEAFKVALGVRANNDHSMLRTSPGSGSSK